MNRHLFTTLLLLNITIFSSHVNAQSAATTLNENFDVKCVVSNTFPSPDWRWYNPPSTSGDGSWLCNATNGRSGTPGIQCTGYFSSAFHVDTSYLLTPLLNITSYPGSVYLQFDSKTQNIALGARLRVFEAIDSTIASPIDTDVTYRMTPVFTPADSIGWVTHQIDITPYKGMGNFYLAFQYTSTATSGTLWYLDNIRISNIPLGVQPVANHSLPVSVVSGSENEITFVLSAATSGTYQAAVYDVVGRLQYSAPLQVSAGMRSYTIEPYHLPKGINILKITSENEIGITKVSVP